MKIEVIAKDIRGIKPGTLAKLQYGYWVFAAEEKVPDTEIPMCIVSYHKDIVEFNPKLMDVKKIYEPEDVKAGSYWELDGEVIRISSIEQYGANYQGLSKYGWLDSAFFDRLCPATTSEIEAILIKEAERRGYKGKRIRILVGPFKGTISEPTMEGEYNYSSSTDSLEIELASCGSYTLYSKGIWAEIIENESRIIERLVERDKKLTDDFNKIFNPNSIPDALEMLNKLQSTVQSQVGKLKNYLKSLEAK
jgi:hypothetical protein